MPNIWAIFTTGLITGGITCVMVQGGLLTALVASQSESGEVSKRAIVIKFLLSKLVAYSILGFILGWLGSVVIISPSVYGIGQIVVGMYMLFVIGAMLDIHPFFRRFLIAPPKWAGRILRNQSKSNSEFAPIVLGVLTIFIPCGTTQAMEAAAIASGNALYGFLTMFVFTLGTLPLFIILGLGVVKMSQVFQRRFAIVASLVVGYIAISGFNAGLILMGSPVYPSGLLRQAYCAISFCSVSRNNPTDFVNVVIDDRGYTVDNSTIYANRDITVSIKNRGGVGCQQVFTIPSVNVSKLVLPGEEAEVKFKSPEKPGVLAYSCGMGMFEGQFSVVN